MEQLNLTEAGTNLTDQLNFTEYANIYKASGILHLLLVVIPVLLLGPLVLGLFISNKRLRDPSSILFMCITCVCIIGPSTYGLLMDISLITGIPTLGSCEIFAGRVFWFQLFLYQTILMVSNSLLVVAQYTVIRWGKEKLPIRLTIPLFFIVASLTMTVTFLSFSTSFTETSEEAVLVRGSLCLIATSFLLARAILALWTLTRTVIVGVFSFLTVKYVKKNTVQNKKVVRDVQIIMVTMTISVIIFRFLPIGNFVAQGQLMSIEKEELISWILGFSSELSYPLFLILTLLVHKAVRNTLVEKIKAISCTSIKRHSNRVGPTSNIKKDTSTKALASRV